MSNVDFSQVGLPPTPHAAPEPPPITAGGWRAKLTNGWLWVVAGAGIISAWAHWNIGLNNDHLDLIDQAQRLLAGGTPYVAYADVNPPLIHLLYALILMLGRPLGLSAQSSLYAFTLIAIAASLFLSARILRASGVQKNTRRVAVSAIAIGLLCASFVHQPFADREHLMLVLATPFMVLYSPMAQRGVVPLKLRVPAVAMAALGFAIKPYFYVFYAAVMIYHLASGRTWQTLIREWEHWVIGLFGLAYLGCIIAFFPEYTHHVFPLALHTYSVTSWDMNSKMNVIQTDLITGYGIAAFAASAVLLFVAAQQWERSFTYLYALLGATIASYLLNGGWYYTQYPFVAVASVLTVAVIARFVAISRTPVMLAGAGALALWGLFCLGGPMLSRAQWDINMQAMRGHPLENIEMPGEAAQQISAILDTHPRFIYLTHSLRAVNLLIPGTARENVGRFDYLWPLPGLLALQQQPQNAPLYKTLSDYFVGAMADDVEQQKPDVVINNISPYQWGFPASFNPLRWLLEHPRFAEAWEPYQLDHTIDVCSSHIHENCAYEIYYRAP